MKVKSALLERFGRSWQMAQGAYGSDKAVSIRLASEITGVEIHTLRYWEKEFEGHLNPIRTPGGQRRYRPEDIQTVLLLKRLLKEEMFSLAGAKKHLSRRLDSAA